MKPPDDDDSNDARGEDPDLWAYVTKGVKPLAGRKAEKPAAAKQRKAKQIRPGPESAPAAPAAKDTPKSREVDRRTAERLRRGRMKIEARLDLHGMSRAEAHQALRSFLIRCFEKDLRHVLVITGKGDRRGGPGILRQCVPAWLEEPPLRDLVLRFDPAQRRDGGEGALYILLRRRR